MRRSNSGFSRMWNSVNSGRSLFCTEISGVSCALVKNRSKPSQSPWGFSNTQAENLQVAALLGVALGTEFRAGLANRRSRVRTNVLFAAVFVIARDHHRPISAPRRTSCAGDADARCARQQEIPAMARG